MKPIASHFEDPCPHMLAARSSTVVSMPLAICVAVVSAEHVSLRASCNAFACSSTCRNVAIDFDYFLCLSVSSHNACCAFAMLLTLCCRGGAGVTKFAGGTWLERNANASLLCILNGTFAFSRGTQRRTEHVGMYLWPCLSSGTTSLPMTRADASIPAELFRGWPK